MKRNKGFTLVELLSVVVILSLTFMFIIPSITELFGIGTKTETELIEERVLAAAKEYVNNIDGNFYRKLYKEGDVNYIYKSDLLNAGLISNEEISKLNTFAGVKGEVIKNDKIRYTVEYINNSSDEYTIEELYLMIENTNKNVDNNSKSIKNLQNQSSGDSTTNISLLSVYPVGSIYMSENDTSPEELFGGSWEEYGAGRTLIGVDSAQEEFATVGKTGGEKTHTLTVDEMPSHNHKANTNATFTVGSISGGDGVSGIPNNVSSWGSYTKAHWFSITIAKTGSSSPHNNLQPYITVYMWKRTA